MPLKQLKMDFFFRAVENTLQDASTSKIVTKRIINDTGIEKKDDLPVKKCLLVSKSEYVFWFLKKL